MPPKRTPRTSPPRPRTETAARTREALIAAATAELAERGIDAASLDEICARAGFTRGAFYVHFRDRDDLLIAVLERVIARHQDALLPREGSDLGATIARFVAQLAAGDGATAGTPQWRFRHTLAACARVPELRRRYLILQRQGVRRVADAAEAGQRARRIRRDLDAEAIGELLVVLSLGLSAAAELDLPLHLARGADTLTRMLAPPRARRPRTRG